LFFRSVIHQDTITALSASRPSRIESPLHLPIHGATKEGTKSTSFEQIQLQFGRDFDKEFVQTEILEKWSLRDTKQVMLQKYQITALLLVMGLRDDPRIQHELMFIKLGSSLKFLLVLRSKFL
jgi:hypothetical protein